MDEASRIREREIAADMLNAGRAPAFRPDAQHTKLPAWVFADASAASGIAETDMRAAMRSYVHPARCDVEIALLQAMLNRPADVDPSTLAEI